jgi:hypothetical protein
MHFAKQKLEQKQNSFHAKNFKVQKLYSSHIQNKDQKKDPSSFRKGRFQVHKKIVGILKKIPSYPTLSYI